MARVLLSSLVLGSRVSGVVQACVVCGELFVWGGRSDYCSGACREKVRERPVRERRESVALSATARSKKFREKNPGYHRDWMRRKRAGEKTA